MYDAAIAAFAVLILKLIEQLGSTVWTLYFHSIIKNGCYIILILAIVYNLIVCMYFVFYIVYSALIFFYKKGLYNNNNGNMNYFLQ